MNTEKSKEINSSTVIYKPIALVVPLLAPILLSLCFICYVPAYPYADNRMLYTDSISLVLDTKDEKQIKQLEKKYQKLVRDFRAKREKVLTRLQQQEQKITIPVRGDQLLSLDSVYGSIRSGVDRIGISTSMSQLNSYLPRLDSLTTGVNYLRRSGVVQLDGLATISQQLQAEWNKTQFVQAFVNDRYRQLQSSISNVAAVKMLRKMQQDIGYYQLQVAKYKQLLMNPDALLAAVLELAKRQKGFAAFMSSNSQLAGLFGVSGNGSGVPLTGLQTIAGTQQQLTQQIAGNGIGNPSQFLTEQLNKGDQMVQVLQNKVNQLGGGDQMMMPDFKPNMQRTKKFMERWVWGVNLQSQRPNGWLPTTTDLGLMVGYQFTDKIIAGGGLAYKMGWGKSISNIRFSHEGVGLRLFTDIKLKGSIWISGGYEWNHQAAFSRIRDLSALSSWQRSGLIGFSKKYSIGKKKGSIQLLWDFLSYQQMPQGRALKFRVGYGL